jgi:hypothetical protein
MAEASFARMVVRAPAFALSCRGVPDFEAFSTAV